MSFDPFNLFSLPSEKDSKDSTFGQDDPALDSTLTMEEVPLQRIGLDSYGRLQIVEDFLLQLNIADAPEAGNENSSTTRWRCVRLLKPLSRVDHLQDDRGL